MRISRHAASPIRLYDLKCKKRISKHAVSPNHKASRAFRKHVYFFSEILLYD